MSFPKLTLKVNPRLYKILSDGFPSSVTKLGLKYLLRIKLAEDPALDFADFRFIFAKDNSDLTEQYST
jgi:hypothetical protein